MSKKQNAVWRDTPDLVAEVWLELTSNHGHEGKDFEVHLKWGHNMQTGGLVHKEGIKTWLVTPTGEAREIVLAPGGPDFYALKFPTPVDGFYHVVTINSGNYVMDQEGKYLPGTRKEHPDADQAIFYNQYAQVILPVGHGLEDVPGKANMPLEIIAHLWKQWRAGDEINLQVQFRGEPLAGATVDFVCKGPGGYQNWQDMTGANGEITLIARDPGYYLIVVRHRVPEGEEGVYDERSFTVTLWFMVTK